MTDYIIIAVVAVVILLAVRSGIKRLRGETSCCGSSTYKARSRKLDTVAERKTFLVEGMSCQNCVNRVMEAVNSIDGVSASVHLKKGEVAVSAEQEIDDEVIRNAITKAGYTVTGIR